mgnify:CR=1 FL=1
MCWASGGECLTPAGLSLPLVANHLLAPLRPSTPCLQIAALQAKLAGAEDSAKAADGIAQAAMEAAEEAVRDEMETIAGGWGVGWGGGWDGVGGQGWL